jgi:hypothetical protein
MDFECKPLPADLLQYGCRAMSNEWQSIIPDGYGFERNVSSCGHFIEIPGAGSQLMSGYEVTPGDQIDELLATRIFSLMNVFTNQPYLNGSISFPLVRSRIIDFIVASTPDGFDGVRANQTPVLTECEVHWAVKLIQSEITNGVLRERTLRTLPFENEPAKHWDSEDSNLYRLQPELDLPDPHNPSQSLSFSVQNITARKVWQTWAQLAPSSLIENRSLSIGASSGYGHFMKLVPLAADSGAPHMAEVERLEDFPWQASRNISSHMSGIVQSMNQVIRNKAFSGGEDYVLGQTWRNTVIVDVDWPWFAFPATIWSAAVAFLSITIWRTSQAEKKIGPYKTSLLPMLVDGGHGTCCQKPVHRSMGSLRKMAKTTTLETPPSREGG